jgi:hypothetical protein
MQAGISMLITDKVNFKQKLVRRDKEGCFILIMGTIKRKEQLLTYMCQMLVHPSAPNKH